MIKCKAICIITRVRDKVTQPERGPADRWEPGTGQSQRYSR
jgi:hypothetical protein